MAISNSGSVGKGRPFVPTKQDVLWAHRVRNDLFLFNEDPDFDNLPFPELIKILQIADDQYYNHDGNSPLADDEYDAIRRYCQAVDPNHTYFLGVGAEVRGGKVKLPYSMGSLDQLYTGELEGWVAEKKLKNETVIVTEKLDGTSGLVVYDQKLQIAYSRGDGVQGADITRHIRRFKCIPDTVSDNLVVRGEIILSKENFEKVKSLVKSRGGREYKNARNTVAGLMNSSEIDPAVYQYLDFVAYDIVNKPMDKTEMLRTLNALGFLTPVHVVLKGSDLNDTDLTDTLNRLRGHSLYEIDGVVVDVDSVTARRKLVPSRETLNPAFAIKYKVADASNLAIAEVIGVEWNVSKHGYLKPRVNIKPVNLVGVTVQYATGFNAKFIYENNIGPGAKIQITRSGDVIPFIQAVVHPTKAQMPSVDWAWNDTEVDAVVVSKKDNQEIITLQILDFFSSIKAPLLKAGNVGEMADHAGGFASASYGILYMISKSEKEWVDVVGSNGKKIYAGLKAKLASIPLFEVAGAVPFFGRGVGVRKMKKLINGLGIKTVNDLTSITLSKIVSVEGFDEKTAHKILNGMPEFVNWWKTASLYITLSTNAVATGGSMEGQKVVFTGFRDAELEKQVEEAGGEIQSGVSSKTTLLVCADPSSNSGKAKKARDLGIKVVGVDELKEMIDG